MRANKLLGIVPSVTTPQWTVVEGTPADTTDGNLATRCTATTVSLSPITCFTFDLGADFIINTINTKLTATFGGGSFNTGYVFILTYDSSYTILNQITIPVDGSINVPITTAYGVMKKAQYIYIGMDRYVDATSKTLYLYELQAWEYGSEPVVSDSTDSFEEEAWQVQHFGRKIAPIGGSWGGFI